MENSIKISIDEKILIVLMGNSTEIINSIYKKLQIVLMKIAYSTDGK